MFEYVAEKYPRCLFKVIGNRSWKQILKNAREDTCNGVNFLVKLLDYTYAVTKKKLDRKGFIEVFSENVSEKRFYITFPGNCFYKDNIFIKFDQSHFCKHIIVSFRQRISQRICKMYY